MRVRRWAMRPVGTSIRANSPSWQLARALAQAKARKDTFRFLRCCGCRVGGRRSRPGTSRPDDTAMRACPAAAPRASQRRTSAFVNPLPATGVGRECRAATFSRGYISEVVRDSPPLQITNKSTPKSRIRSSMGLYVLFAEEAARASLRTNRASSNLPRGGDDHGRFRSGPAEGLRFVANSNRGTLGLSAVTRSALAPGQRWAAAAERRVVGCPRRLTRNRDAFGLRITASRRSSPCR